MDDFIYWFVIIVMDGGGCKVDRIFQGVDFEVNLFQVLERDKVFIYGEFKVIVRNFYYDFRGMCCFGNFLSI